VLHVRDIQPVLVNNCLLSFLTAAARSPAAVLCALLFVMPRLARAFITPGKTNAAAGTDTARIAANTNTFPPIQIAPKARVQVFRIAFNISRVMLLCRFHLIIPGNQKTEFRSQRSNSRALLPFNQSGFERIRGVVKNNGSQQQML